MEFFLIVTFEKDKAWLFRQRFNDDSFHDSGLHDNKIFDKCWPGFYQFSFSASQIVRSLIEYLRLLAGRF